jgi:hypothetical protein
MNKNKTSQFGTRKNAQSGLIVGVILILIAIISLIVLWNIFNPLLNEKSKEVDINLLNTHINLQEAGLFANGAYRIKVIRGNDPNPLDSLKFVLYDGTGNSHTESIEENLPNSLEYKTYFFSPIENFGKMKRISVYPIIHGKTGIESSLDYSNIIEIPAGLVSWFRLNDNFDDFAGRNNGISTGGVSINESFGRKSVYFNLGSLDFGNDSSLSLNQDFAISFWLETDSNNTLILRKGKINPNYEIGINEDGTVNFSYTAFGVRNSNSGFSDISDGKWHNIAITNMAIYIDGNPDKNINFHGQLDTNSENSIVGEGLNGYLNEVMIFNRSLDFGQVQGIFNLQK